MTDRRTTPAQELQGEFLKTMRESQEAIIEAIKIWVKSVQSLTPKMPAVEVPLVDKLPKPEAIVASGYDFAEQVLASQRRFAEEVLRVTTPLLPGPPAGGGGERPEPKPDQGTSPG